MSLKDWQARWGHHVPAQAIAELTDILSPVMPSPAPTARHSESAAEEAALDYFRAQGSDPATQDQSTN
jgi:hypothetical protein